MLRNSSMNTEYTNIANWDLNPWEIQREVMFVVVTPVIIKSSRM